MYYEQLLAESRRLDAQIKTLKKQQLIYPQGTLRCSMNGKYTKWYFNDGHRTTYIRKQDHTLLQKYAVYEYLSCSIDDLTTQKKLIDSYLSNYNKTRPKTEKFFSKHPELIHILQPYFESSRSHPSQIEEWLSTPFQPNPAYPEQLSHRCPSGNIVRSKSEAMIDTLLYSNQIPYKYECPLFLDGMVVYPDFTIMHPITMEIHYWEHYGMMDSPTYIKSVSQKTQSYALNGIVPTINLHITCETKASPLTFETINTIIQTKFLK